MFKRGLSTLAKAMGRYKVVRVDTHGNQFDMVKGLSEEEAKRVAEVYEEKGHKQGYFVQKQEEPIAVKTGTSKNNKR